MSETIKIEAVDTMPDIKDPIHFECFNPKCRSVFVGERSHFRESDPFDCLKCGERIYTPKSNWRTEPPTEPGFYWVKWKASGDVTVTEVDTEIDQSDLFESITHFLGPLPAPEMPR